MPIISFPPIENSDLHGLLAIGGDLSIPSLKLAYSKGIFPWPIENNLPLTWFCPDPRGIIAYEDLHISKSMKKIIKSNIFEIKFNHDFESVISACATSSNRKEGEGTWITEDMRQAYIELFHCGLAYSAETYLEGALVGGVYGVCINGIISGESMFYKYPNASKFALIKLMKLLYNKGINWIDTQMISPVVADLGGKEISRNIFIEKLAQVDKDIEPFDY